MAAESGGTWDAIVIGSGFGGAMAAWPLVHAGWRVLMIERGGWVERGPQNWTPAGVGLRSPHYSMETPYLARTDSGRRAVGSFHCVGGQSVFYGGAALRLRERDLEHDPEIVGASGAAWPLDYAALEPWYAQAERLLGVAGESGIDPTEPRRSTSFAQAPGALSPISGALATAARSLGLNPFRIPLAINHAPSGERRACIACGTCDGHACAVRAKNDVAVALVPALQQRGMGLREHTVAAHLEVSRRRVSAVHCVDTLTGAPSRLTARHVVLAAGALASPHLLLASGLDRLSVGGHTIGRYLTRHCNRVVFGIFPRRLAELRRFDKQIAINDFYFGHPTIATPRGRLGNIQQLTPPAALIEAHLGRTIGRPAAAGAEWATGLLVIAEDQPNAANGVTIDPDRRDRFGMPVAHVTHRYSRRDRAAARALADKAREILYAAGAWSTLVHRIDTFSHAVGTVRMGADPRTSALDEYGALRGLDNLFVSDASIFPRAAAVNPSLTIAALALRIGHGLASAGTLAAPGSLPAAQRAPLPLLSA